MNLVTANLEKTPTREWLDLRDLTFYASVSERTLREWIHRFTNPLPAVRVGNKLLVSRTTFDKWLAAHAVEPSQTVDVIVNDVVRRMKD